MGVTIHGGPLELTCDLCGESFEHYPSGIKGKKQFRSPEWLSETFIGESHLHPTGVAAEPTPAVRDGLVRAGRPLERDDHTCVSCGTTASHLGQNPDVHHIIPVRAFVASPTHDRADAHVLANLITLCPGCYRRAEFGAIDRAVLWAAIDIDDPATRFPTFVA